MISKLISGTTPPPTINMAELSASQLMRKRTWRTLHQPRRMRSFRLMAGPMIRSGLETLTLEAQRTILPSLIKRERCGGALFSFLCFKMLGLYLKVQCTPVVSLMVPSTLPSVFSRPCHYMFLPSINPSPHCILHPWGLSIIPGPVSASRRFVERSLMIGHSPGKSPPVPDHL